MATFQTAVADIAREVIAEVEAAIPTLVVGAVLVLVAAVLIRVVTWIVRLLLRRALPDEPVYVEFAVTVTAGVLWFAVALAVLSVVGLQEIALALGTASGFVALGVSYALSGMIKDAVSGVYLLRDPDFEPGDRVTAKGTTGEVKSIELRKTRLAVEGDTVVLANAEIEREWTRRAEAPPAADPDEGSDAGATPE